jgi:hypothetical protein
MSSAQKSDLYRVTIDALVQACKQGSGRVGAARVDRRIWNLNADSLGSGDAQELNVLLKSLTEAQRSALANALVKEFEAGVYEALKVLEENKVSPFESGYEGSPQEDFIGRLGGWQWPRS